jgi:hypothetical protein
LKKFFLFKVFEGEREGKTFFKKFPLALFSPRKEYRRLRNRTSGGILYS